MPSRCHYGELDMKARIPKIKAKDKKQLKQEIDILVTAALAEKEEKIHKDLTRRILKTFVYVMHTDFGYGRTRLERLLEAFTIQLEKSDTDEVYWEHIDRVVMDELKLDFGKRDYTNHGRVVNYD